MLQYLYVSRAALSEADASREVERIVAQAQLKNQERAITGALIYTGNHFAQRLEGPKAEVEALIAKIAGDARHRDMVVVEQWPLAARRYGDWSMAYSGPCFQVDRQVRVLLSGAEGSFALRARQALLEAFDQMAGRSKDVA